MFTKYKLQKESGLTLVELLLAVGILSVLVSGIFVLVNPLQKIGQANDAKRKSDIVQITRALEIYYQDNAQYPASTGTYTITGTNWGGAWPSYMSRLPQDPTAGYTYVYYTPNSGTCSNYQCYYIFANLQRGGSDRQACFPGTGNACANAVNYGLSNSCGATCNYGVSSPNTSP